MLDKYKRQRRKSFNRLTLILFFIAGRSIRQYKLEFPVKKSNMIKYSRRIFDSNAIPILKTNELPVDHNAIL
jgi:hypothetical protein